MINVQCACTINNREAALGPYTYMLDHPSGVAQCGAEMKRGVGVWVGVRWGSELNGVKEKAGGRHPVEHSLFAAANTR